MTNIFHSILTNSSETVKQHNVAYQSSSKFEHPPRSLSPYFLAANHSQLQTLSMSKFFQKNVTFKPHHPHFRLPRSLSRSSTFLIDRVSWRDTWLDSRTKAKKARWLVGNGGRVSAMDADISIQVSMNLVDRFKARGANESRTGAIAMKRRSRVCKLRFIRALAWLHWIGWERLTGRHRETCDISRTINKANSLSDRSLAKTRGSSMWDYRCL